MLGSMRPWEVLNCIPLRHDPPDWPALLPRARARGLRSRPGHKVRRRGLDAGWGEHHTHSRIPQPHLHKERRRGLRHPRWKPDGSPRREHHRRRGRALDVAVGETVDAHDAGVRFDPGRRRRQPSRPPEQRRGHGLCPLQFLVHLQRRRRRHSRRRRATALSALRPERAGQRPAVGDRQRTEG